jgi:hydroxymethylbilane synthase
LKTTGDRIQDVSLAKVGGKGLFVKEIEEALLEGTADVAVHSAKDLPAQLAGGLVLAAFPQREDARDALVARDEGASLEGLRKGARVGTGSARRIAQLLALRPDLELVPLRGNVPTRVEQIESRDLDAVVLACAGLDRLELSQKISQRIDSELMLPAACQGVLALEVREGDPLREEIAALSDDEVAVVARAERAFLGWLGGDCSVPVAAHAERVDGASLRLRGLVASADGTVVVRAEERAPVEQAEALGARVAEAVLKAGGAEILEGLRAEVDE